MDVLLGSESLRVLRGSRSLAQTPRVVSTRIHTFSALVLQVTTNIIFWDVAPSLTVAHFLARCEASSEDAMRLQTVARLDATTPPATALCRLIAAVCGAKMNPYGNTRVRAVVHHQVTSEHIHSLLVATATAAALMKL